MPETDAEHRDVGGGALADRVDRIIAGRGIAGAGREEHAVRVHREYLRGGRLCRHHCQATAAIDQHAQDIALDAVVVGDDVIRQLLLDRVRRLGQTVFQRPRTLQPFVRLDYAHHLREVHAVQTGKFARGRDGTLLVDAVTGRDAAVLRALLAQETRELAGIDAGDGDDLVAAQIRLQRFFRAPAAQHARHVAYDQAAREHRVRLLVLGVGADVADVRVGQRIELL